MIGDVRIDATLGSAPAEGDPRLAESLVANLVGNALRHNVPDGWASIATSTVGGRAVLRVSNSGPVIPPTEVDRLFQPFQRLGDERVRRRDGGHGLGLAIVRAIAVAHGAELTARARPEGGLDIAVTLPASVMRPAAAIYTPTATAAPGYGTLADTSNSHKFLIICQMTSNMFLLMTMEHPCNFTLLRWLRLFSSTEGSRVKKETSVEQSKPASGTADNVRVSRRALLGGASALAAGGALTVTGGGIARAATRTPAKSVTPPSVSATTSRAAALKDSSFLPSLNSIPSRKNLVDYEVVELAAMLRAGKVSSVELTQAYLDRISKLNGPFETYGNTGFYNAFVRINEAQALAAAAAADKALAAARRNGPPVSLLCGIPMGIKDSVGIKGFSTQDGSPTFAGNVALNDATIVGKLRAAGVVLIGNTICSAFSGSITGTFAGNAWNPLYVPGGSSQGSGVAPIARLAAACIGEETGGSITMPSAANGASGIKPSLGTVSIAGLMPLSPGYDVLGPISRSGRDSALILNTILGPDPFNDPQTLAAPDPFPLIPMTPRLGGKPLQGTTIGVPQTDWMIANGQVQTGVSPQSTYGAGHLAVFNRLVERAREPGREGHRVPGPGHDGFLLEPVLLQPRRP